MSNRSAPRLGLAALVATTLLGCGGGSTDIASGGIGGTGITMGRIDGFGSVFVDGIEYFTDGGVIIVDGEQLSENDLRVGMVVELTGSVNQDGTTGTASRIEFDDDVEGPISAVNHAQNQINVLGQLVTYDDETVFEDNSGALSPLTVISELGTEMLVEVSGYSNIDGAILATRIELRSASYNPGVTLEVEGIVRDLDTVAQTFRIGALTIDYSALLQTPFAGDYVEVKGTSATASGPLIATSIEVEDEGHGALGDDGDLVKLEGIVTAPLSGELFRVNGRPVRLVIGTTLFERGDPSGIVLNAGIEVEGQMEGTTLVASKIELGHSEGEKLQLGGLVESRDADAGTVVVLGQTLHIDSETLMHDDFQKQHDFSLSHLSVSDQIEVRVVDEEGRLRALKLEREEPKTPPAEVTGVVAAVNGDQIELVSLPGLTIDLSGVALRPNPNDRIEVEGTYSGGVLTATGAEREDDD